jgi:RNA polymerase sigma-70 factor (ECF subfamily)
MFLKEGSTTSTGEVERLVEASQAGQRCAFDELVRMYQRRAMRAALRILGDVNEAAEAVQDGFVKAYVEIGKLRDVRRFEVWLLRIVVNTAISRQRARKRRLKRIQIAEELEDKKTAGPVERISEMELKEAIKEAMGNLSKKEAKAIGLFGMDGLSQEKAARIMGCSAGAVRWHVFKARQKLKVLLKEFLE